MYKLSLKVNFRPAMSWLWFCLLSLPWIFNAWQHQKASSSPQSAFFVPLSASLWSKNVLYLNTVLYEDIIWAEFRLWCHIKAFQKLITRNIWRNPEGRKAPLPISGLPFKRWHHIWSVCLQIHQCHLCCVFQYEICLYSVNEGYVRQLQNKLILSWIYPKSI